jgi:tetratricopeptide (TPR) repeat protein
VQDDLATAHRRSGQLDEAESIYRSVLALRQKLHGRDSEITLRSLALLALTLAAKENYREAVRLNEEGLSIAEKVNGRESLVYATFLNNLALQQSTLGMDAVALERMRAALGLARTIFPDNAPTRAQMERNLGVVLRRAKQSMAAYAQLLLALEANRRIHGDEHPEVATVRVHLAEVSVDLGRLDEARMRIDEVERMPKAASAGQAPNITRLQARIAAAETRDEEALRLFVLAEKMIADLDRQGKLDSWLFKLPRLEFMASRHIDDAARAAEAALVLQEIEDIVDPQAAALEDLRRLMKP